MFDFIPTLSFVHVAAFTLMLASPLLIVPYLRRRSGKSVVVSSVLILKTLPKRARIRKRVKLPLRFFLELVALLLFCTALALPALKDLGKPIAVVFDTSMSMGAHEPDGQSRIVAARNALTGWLGKSSFAARFTLFRSSPKLVAVTENLSADELRSQVNSLEPTLAADSLVTELGQLANSNQFRRVLVVTDRVKPNTADSTLPSSIEILSTGSAVSNVYFTQAAIDSVTDPSPGFRLTAIVSASAANDVPVSVTLSGLPNSRDAETPLAKKSVVVSHEGETSLSFLLPKDTGDLTLFHLRLQPDNPQLDSISGDNEAWLGMSSQSTRKLLLISPLAQAGNSLGLSRLTSFGVTALTPERYATLSESERETYSAIIFHRSATSAIPQKPALFILPPVDNPVFPIIDNATNPKITSWLETNPLTTYLKASLISPAAAEIFRADSWVSPVINTEQGSMLVSGEYQGVRMVGVGFELLPYEGKDTPTLSVLTLNIFNWLIGKKELGNVNVTGEQFEKPGAYPVTNSAGRSEVTVVNAYHLEESQTFQRLPLQLQTSVPELGTEAPPSSLWQYILLLALLILLFELSLRVRSPGVA